MLNYVSYCTSHSPFERPIVINQKQGGCSLLETKTKTSCQRKNSIKSLDSSVLLVRYISEVLLLLSTCDLFFYVNTTTLKGQCLEILGLGFHGSSNTFVMIILVVPFKFFLQGEDIRNSGCTTGVKDAGSKIFGHQHP
jgi:hypothetical protein